MFHENSTALDLMQLGLTADWLEASRQNPAKIFKITFSLVNKCTALHITAVSMPLSRLKPIVRSVTRHAKKLDLEFHTFLVDPYY